MEINRSTMASVASSLPNSSCDYWHNCNSSGSPEVTPSKLVVIDCNTTGSAKLRRRKTLSNIKSIGFESVLLEKHQRIGIYRAFLTIPNKGCLGCSLNIKNAVRLKLVAWGIWKSGGRSDSDKGSLMVEVELGGVEEGSHDNDDNEGATTETEGNPIRQGRHSSPLVLLHANLCVMDPVRIEETTLEVRLILHAQIFPCNTVYTTSVV